MNLIIISVQRIRNLESQLLAARLRRHLRDTEVRSVRMDSQRLDVRALVDEMCVLCALLRRQQEQSNLLRDESKRLREESRLIRTALNRDDLVGIDLNFS